MSHLIDNENMIKSSHQNNLNSFFEAYVFVLLFITGLAFTFLIPPFQKPDEESHFNRTLALVNGVTSCAPGYTVIMVPEQYYAMTAFIKSYEMPLHPDHKLPSFISQIYLHSNKKAAPIAMEVNAVCNFPIISYLPSALGVFIGLHVSPNPYVTFFLGRFTLFLACFIWLIYLYKKTKYKSLLLFVASIPMFLHQISAYGYDGATFLLTLTLFVKVTELMNKEQMIEVRDYISLSIISILYLLSRSGGHELLLLFILLIPPQKIHKKTYVYFLYMIVFYALMFGIYGLTKIHAVTSFIGNGLPAGADPVKQIQFILHHPLDLLMVLMKTSVLRSTFYVQSMIGILGWLEYGIPHWMYGAYAAIGIWLITIRNEKDNTNMSWYQIISGLTILLLNYVYILGIFYVVWTPVGAQIVNGVQGRYFLTSLPFVLYLAHNLVKNPTKRVPHEYVLTRWIYIGSIALCMLINLYLINTIYHRYYISSDIIYDRPIK